MKKRNRGLSILVAYGVLSLSGFAGTMLATKAAKAEVQSASTSVTLQRGPTSREKTLYWNPFIVRNRHGDTATEIRDFKVTITEQKSPTGKLLTKYITTWKYHNYTQDDKSHTSVKLHVTLLNKERQPIDAQFSGSSPRNHCTYNPQWEDGSFPDYTSNNNYFDLITSGKLHWGNPASYEGNC